MIDLLDVYIAINHTLKATFKDIRVYKERVKKSGLDRDRLDTNLLTIEPIRFKTSPHSRYIINKSLDFDIIYMSKDNKVIEALQVADKLMGAFSMGLSVKAYRDGVMVDKRHLHCLQSPEYKLVDQDLHFLVKFDFADGYHGQYLGDDGEIKDYDRDVDPGEKYVLENDFVEDIGFDDDKKKKEYEEERLKFMQDLYLNYVIEEV